MQPTVGNRPSSVVRRRQQMLVEDETQYLTSLLSDKNRGWLKSALSRQESENVRNHVNNWVSDGMLTSENQAAFRGFATTLIKRKHGGIKTAKELNEAVQHAKDITVAMQVPGEPPVSGYVYGALAISVGEHTGKTGSLDIVKDVTDLVREARNAVQVTVERDSLIEENQKTNVVADRLKGAMKLRNHYSRQNVVDLARDFDSTTLQSLINLRPTMEKLLMGASQRGFSDSVDDRINLSLFAEVFQQGRQVLERKYRDYGHERNDGMQPVERRQILGGLFESYFKQSVGNIRNGNPLTTPAFLGSTTEIIMEDVAKIPDKGLDRMEYCTAVANVTNTRGITHEYYLRRYSEAIRDVFLRPEKQRDRRFVEGLLHGDELELGPLVQMVKRRERELAGNSGKDEKKKAA